MTLYSDVQSAVCGLIMTCYNMIGCDTLCVTGTVFHPMQEPQALLRYYEDTNNHTVTGSILLIHIKGMIIIYTYYYKTQSFSALKHNLSYFHKPLGLSKQLCLEIINHHFRRKYHSVTLHYAMGRAQLVTCCRN